MFIFSATTKEKTIMKVTNLTKHSLIIENTYFWILQGNCTNKQLNNVHYINNERYVSKHCTK